VILFCCCFTSEFSSSNRIAVRQGVSMDGGEDWREKDME
jgi:hypothetical protein